MSQEDCRSTALAALCIPGTWEKHGVVSYATFGDFALWHNSEKADRDPSWHKERIWAYFKSFFGFKWIELSPAIREAIPRSEIGYFKEFLRDELARITATDVVRKVAK